MIDGVVELVGDHGVLGRRASASNRPPLASKQERVEDRVLGAEERREPRFELLVLGLGAADEPDAGHAEAPLVERCLGRRDDLRMIGEAEVVVGAEVQHLAARSTRIARRTAGCVSTRSSLYSPASRISSSVPAARRMLVVHRDSSALRASLCPVDDDLAPSAARAVANACLEVDAGNR